MLFSWVKEEYDFEMTFKLQIWLRILMNYDVEQNINMSLCMHIIYDDIMRLFLRERERERMK